LQAIGGPVSWNIGEAGLLNGAVTISPSAGDLGAGQQVTVTVTADLLATGDVLSVSPCGHAYILVVASGELLGADSPSATAPAPPSAAAGVQPPASGGNGTGGSAATVVARKAEES
jgi:hypothetical protein